MRHMGRSRGAREADGPSSEGLPSATLRPRDTPAKCAPLFPSLRARPSRSRGVPCEALDAPDNLSKKSRRQVALRQLQDEVPRVPNEAPAGLEQPLLETREMLPRPARGVRAANDRSVGRRAGRYHSRSAASTAPVRKLFCNFRSSGEGPPGSRLTWSCSGCFKELSAACFSRVEVA